MSETDLRKRLGELWEDATSLSNPDEVESPLTDLIIQECFDASEGEEHPLDWMEVAMRNLATDCEEFARLIGEESGRCEGCSHPECDARKEADDGSG
ncbi:hypothetical protein LCGC14_2963050 [marine sediment metagenome]|uniref:Uncharacterized protein n=1 Tax=marine sediment metagenome TaxID=412755 RepID=A0A0F8XBM2_9ZZZZ